jgi:hypothetical protein
MTDRREKDRMLPGLQTYIASYQDQVHKESEPLLDKLDIIRADWPQALIHYGRYCLVWKGVNWRVDRPIEKVLQFRFPLEDRVVRRRLVQSGAFVGWTEHRWAKTYVADEGFLDAVSVQGEVPWEIDQVEFKYPESERDRRWMRKAHFQGMQEYPYRIGELGREPSSAANWLLSPLGVLKEGHGNFLLAGVARTKDLRIQEDFVLSTKAPVLPIDIFSSLWLYSNFSVLREVFSQGHGFREKSSEISQSEAVKRCKDAGKKILENPETRWIEIDSLESEMRNRVRRRAPNHATLEKIFAQSRASIESKNLLTS